MSSVVAPSISSFGFSYLGGGVYESSQVVVTVAGTYFVDVVYNGSSVLLEGVDSVRGPVEIVVATADVSSTLSTVIANLSSLSAGEVLGTTVKLFDVYHNPNQNCTAADETKIAMAPSSVHWQQIEKSISQSCGVVEFAIAISTAGDNTVLGLLSGSIIDEAAVIVKPATFSTADSFFTVESTVLVAGGNVTAAISAFDVFLNEIDWNSPDDSLLRVFVSGLSEEKSLIAVNDWAYTLRMTRSGQYSLSTTYDGVTISDTVDVIVVPGEIHLSPCWRTL